MKKKDLDPLVVQYLKDNRKIMIDGSYRDLQLFVGKKTAGKYLPSLSILYASLKRLGVTVKSRRWLWRHNEAKHE